MPRIGRTGRVGNTGRATSFFDERENAALARPLVKVIHILFMVTWFYVLNYSVSKLILSTIGAYWREAACAWLACWAVQGGLLLMQRFSQVWNIAHLISCLSVSFTGSHQVSLCLTIQQCTILSSLKINTQLIKCPKACGFSYRLGCFTVHFHDQCILIMPSKLWVIVYDQTSHVLVLASWIIALLLICWLARFFA